MRHFTYFLFMLCFVKLGFAQSPTDAEFMPKNNICIAAMYGHDAWNKYWESTLFRENGNIGTLTKQSFTPMIAYGLSDKIVINVGLPYVKSSASQGTIEGNDGFQDLSLSLKSKFFQSNFSSFEFSTIGVLAGSIPVTNYNEDYGPLSIGLGAKEVNARLMLELLHNSGFYLRPQFSYHLRDVASIERSYYYNEGGFYSDKIDVPNMTMTTIAMGAKLLDKKLRGEIAYNIMATQGGAEIRRHEAPLASSNMDAHSANFFIQYYPSFVNNVSIILAGGKVLSGQNVGKSTFYNFGLTYQFGLSKTSENDTQK
jgi:hypothetical protein